MHEKFVEGVTLLPDITCDDDLGQEIGVQAIKETPMEDLIPVKYLIPWPELDVDRTYFISARRNSSTGQTKWVIEEMGFVIDKNTGRFVYEPLPSNRDDEFIARTRFDSVEEAYEWFQEDLKKQSVES